MSAEKDKLLAKTSGENKVVVQEKIINRYCIPSPFKCDIFSPTYDTGAYHPKILKRSKIPVLQLPLTSVVETVPFQIRKKPIKVTIPHDPLSVLKKPHPGRVLKPKITHNCVRKPIPKIENYRLGEKQKQQVKRAVVRKSSNNFTVMDSKPRANVNFKNDSVKITNKSDVENNSIFETPKSNSKIPVRVTASSAKKNSNKRNQDFLENSTPVRTKPIGSDDNHNTLNKNNNNDKNAVTVEDAAVVFKTLNDYCDKIEKIYGGYETSPSKKIEQKLAEKRKPVLCNPCIPIKFRSEKKFHSPEVVTIVEDKFYGSVESIRSSSSDKRNENNPIEETSIAVHAPIESHGKAASESSSSTDSAETGTTVISVERSVNGSSSERDDLCDSSLCLETFLSASKCFTPPNEEFRAGGDCFNSSVAGNFRYLDYESENSCPNTPDKYAPYRTDAEKQESPNSSYMTNGKRRKSEIFHISFNSDKKKVNKSNPPSVFKVL